MSFGPNDPPHRALSTKERTELTDAILAVEKARRALEETPDTLRQVAEDYEGVGYDRLTACAEAWERAVAAFAKYGRHLRGCKIRPDSPIMRALTPKGETFVPVPCSCGFDDARALMPPSTSDGCTPTTT